MKITYITSYFAGILTPFLIFIIYSTIQNYFEHRTHKIKLKEVIKDGMIWCRNGDVCREATPCLELKCEFKSTESDILNGCLKCDTFQGTRISSKFASAYQTYPVPER